ncbi:MAG: hypothetical protein AAB448_01410 [Patescibacteria group bacterium]
MQKAFTVLGLLGGLLVIGIGVGMLFSTDDTRGFEHAITGRHLGVGYESIMSAYRDKSTVPCATDGLGVNPVPFGVVVSWCDASWFLGMNTFLYQLSGPDITYEDAEKYLAVPNAMSANAILREMHRLFSEGVVPEVRDEALDPSGGVSFGVIRDWGEQTVYPGQVLADMMFGDVRYVIAGQKNMNTPLLDLREYERVEFAGIFAQQDNGPWNVLLDVTETYSKSPASSYLYMKPNVLDLFFEDGELYVDILDSAGAGSGEGNLLRLRYDESGVEQFIVWESVGEMYYLPEVFTREWSWEHLEDGVK